MTDSDKPDNAPVPDLVMVEPGIYTDNDQPDVVILNLGELIADKGLDDSQELRATLFSEFKAGYAEQDIEVVLIEDQTAPALLATEPDPDPIPASIDDESTEPEPETERFDLVKHGRYRCDDPECPWCNTGLPGITDKPTEETDDDDPSNGPT